jgi:hypothetical protein
MKLWSLLPWLCGAALLAGLVTPQQSALVFYRSLLLAAVTVATIGAFSAARSFERGDALFTTWAVLAAGYLLLFIRYVLRLLVTLNIIQLPTMLDRALLILHNIAVPVALWLFVRTWRRTGLAGPMSSGASIAATLAGIVVAIAVGAYPVLNGMHNTDPAVLISTLGDMVSIALIVPLLLPALGMRGGLLMYTWLYLAVAQIVWLMYDVWAVTRTSSNLTAPWTLALDQALRAVAIMYILSAAAAQRRAIAYASEEPTIRQSMSPVTAS